MRIIIAGADEIGRYLARMLGSYDHDISVIDNDAKLLEDIGSVADVVTVEGDPTKLSVLKRASVRKADLFIATGEAESANIVSAALAKTLGAKKSIARIDDGEYLEPNNRDIFISMGIDYLLYPERIVAREVVKLLGHTSTVDYLDFSGGKLALVVLKLDASSPLIGKTLKEHSAGIDNLSYRTAAITREGTTIIPRGHDRFMDGDTIYVVTNRESVRRTMDYAGKKNVEIRNVMILGGSRIGVGIAKELQDKINVKLVEYKEEKAYQLAEILDNTLIINEDGRNIDAMTDEGIASMDAYVAVTGRSETNILAAMLAKKMGVKKIIAGVENLDYINLAESIGIDTIINKKKITAGNIFRFTMSTEVQDVKCLAGTDAEVLEFIVKPNSPATRRKVRDMRFPDNAIIGGIIRGDKVFIAVGDTEIKAYDRVVVFALAGSIDKVGEFFN